MNAFRPPGPLRLAARRLRLLAVLAGLAWLLGITPAMPVRLLVIALVIDALATPRTPTHTRARSGRPTRRGGVRR